ncbi:hypothetical protein M8J75_009361 [Diaphorina citri]|nr:hypothetical protein M8J75_009361 [Diaphorina citri]
MEDYDENEDEIDFADFETAIEQTGFGKYNYFILFSMIPVTVSFMFNTQSMAFILPVISCDFELSSLQKGILNGAIYAGMIPSSLIWGFVTDFKGRQNVLFYGLLGDIFSNLCSALSTSFELLVLFRVLTGIAMCATFSSCYTLLVEYLVQSRRDSGVMMLGCFGSAGSFIQPMIAYFIIPIKWTYPVFDFFLMCSWRIFLIVSTFPSLAGALLVFFIPESPKFLMTHGRSDDALDVFQSMYARNTGKPKDSYPVKSLMGAPPTSSMYYMNRTLRHRVAKGLRQLIPIFHPPLLKTAVVILVLQGLTMMSINVVRLLQPEILASFFNQTGNYDRNLCESLNGETAIKKTPQNMMTSSAYAVFAASNALTRHEFCEKFGTVDTRVYSVATFLGLISFLYYILTVFLVRGLGKKYLYVVSMLICAACICIYPWTQSVYVVMIAAIFLALMSTMISLILGCSVQEFPTSLRAMAVNITMMSGRTGTLVGSILFSKFIADMCQVALLTIGGIIVFCALLMLFGLKELTVEERVITRPTSIQEIEEEGDDMTHSMYMIHT